VSGVRRKAKFIKANIVPSISSKGITSAPKLAAKPSIHSRIATVKIVQNTAFLLKSYGGYAKNGTSSSLSKWRAVNAALVKRLQCGKDDYAVPLPTSSDPISGLRVVCTLVPKKYWPLGGLASSRNLFR
jgi:hypothetical protein